MTKKKTEEKLNYAQALAELKQTTDKFESGEIDLEESAPMVKRGYQLARFLIKRIKKTENEIKEIKAEFKDVEREIKLKKEEPEPEPEESDF